MDYMVKLEKLGISVNTKRLIAVFIDKPNDYQVRLIMLFHGNIRIIAINDVSGNIEAVMSYIKEKIPELKKIDPLLLVNGEVYFIKKDENGTLYNIEGHNIKI